MKRDMDLARAILLKAEDHGFGDVSAEMFPGYEAPVVASHFQLLEEAGLIEASILDVEGEGALEGSVLRLTWEGHEYLDAVRDDEVWQKTKQQVTRKGGTMAFEVVKAVAIAYVKKKVGLGD